MPRLLQLEVFDPATAAPALTAPAPTALDEEARLSAFEQGYSAGWDDATAAQDAELARLRSDLGRNLQELSFTFHEARGHVLRALEPLLADMVGKVLPLIARDSVGAVVLESLKPIAENLANTPIEVIVSPANRKIVTDALTTGAAPPFRIVEEPSLGEGQAYLRLGVTERHIDLDGVIQAIEAAISAFFHPGTEDIAHG